MRALSYIQNGRPGFPSPLLAHFFLHFPCSLTPSIFVPCQWQACLGVLHLLRSLDGTSRLPPGPCHVHHRLHRNTTGQAVQIRFFRQISLGLRRPPITRKTGNTRIYRRHEQHTGDYIIPRFPCPKSTEEAGTAPKIGEFGRALQRDLQRFSVFFSWGRSQGRRLSDAPFSSIS